MSNMNKKILLLGLVVLGIVMCTSTVSAYYTIPKGAGPNYWVVVGGRTATGGGFASSYMANLIPGTYYGAPCGGYSSIAYYDASTPCNSRNSYSGYNSYGSGSSYGWGGAWGNYGNYNTYGGNVGWAKNYPSYNYNYMYTGYV
jgi:hypothetical protein